MDLPSRITCHNKFRIKRGYVESESECIEICKNLSICKYVFYMSPSEIGNINLKGYCQYFTSCSKKKGTSRNGQTFGLISKPFGF